MAQEVAVRKRQQIAKANRLMFIWIAVVSVVVGFAAVGSIFIFQKISYKEKVLTAKSNTVDALKKDNANIGALQDNIRVLQTNQALMSARVNSDEKPVQVVLEALPADANSLALGASLQQKLLSGVPGLTVNTLQVADLSDTGTAPATNGGKPTTSEIPFSFEASGSYDAIKQVLENLEKSIRTINVSNISIQMSNGKLTIAVQAKAYYQSPRTLELYDRVVKP